MVKREYHNPEIEIINLTEADVICASLLNHGQLGDSGSELLSDKFNQKWLV